MTTVPPGTAGRFHELCQRAHTHYREFRTDDTTQQARYDQLLRELEDLLAMQLSPFLERPQPWARLAAWCSTNTSVETQELVNSILLEMHPEQVDELAEFMDADEPFELNTGATIAELLSAIETDYGWALSLDFENPDSQQVFWYRSEEKQEPRLGQRYDECGAEYEMDIGVARDVSHLYRTLYSECIADTLRGNTGQFTRGRLSPCRSSSLQAFLFWCQSLRSQIESVDENHPVSGCAPARRIIEQRRR